jgi:rod shape-determining protein MreD
MFSIRLRTRTWEICLTAGIIFFAWILQSDILTRLSLGRTMCNLPLTFTIVWAAIFGSRAKALNYDSLRVLSLNEVLFRQTLSGSISGAFVGAFFAALYSSVLPIYPVSYPLIGWITGYFSLKKINHAELFAIPLVLFATVFAEFITTCQLMLLGRPYVFEHFMQLALPEAALNALVAPLLYVPISKWYDFKISQEISQEP